MDFFDENLNLSLERAKGLLERFPSTMNIEKKSRLICSEKAVKEAFYAHSCIEAFISHARADEKYCFALLVMLEQFFHVIDGIEHTSLEALQKIASVLTTTEKFYEPMGGLLWYYYETVRRIHDQKQGHDDDATHSIQLREPPRQLSCRERPIRELQNTAAIFPVGGLGERLGLQDSTTRESLPVAYLLFLGRSMLEHLFRDVQALEYMYEKSFGLSLSIPILLMTSEEQGNDSKIKYLLEQNGYFGKNRDDVRFILQPPVPVLDLHGNFALQEPLRLLVRPGGHGVLWRLMALQGAFDWLQKREIEHLLIRQINNPLAGTDSSLIDLVGVAVQQKKLFGFASCPQKEGFAEGVNVLKMRQTEGGHTFSLTNVEYTAFHALLKKEPLFFVDGRFPANANVLYANVHAMKELSKKVVCPGEIVNLKTEFSLFERGMSVRRKACRLESTMQNIADELTSETVEEVPTFLNVCERVKLLSVTKKAFTSIDAPFETPEYCLYDWCRMTRLLLEQLSTTALPSEQSFEQFFKEGPKILFRFHPALGPLWATIKQKIRELSLAPFSDLEIEMAEVELSHLSLDGSLSIRSPCPCGVKGQTQSVPKIYCSNVSIRNRGRQHPTPLHEILKGSQAYVERVEWVLEEGAELYVKDVVFHGSYFLHVPPYTRLVIEQDATTKAITTTTKK